jgi:hypothetical protein
MKKDLALLEEVAKATPSQSLVSGPPPASDTDIATI